MKIEIESNIANKVDNFNDCKTGVFYLDEYGDIFIKEDDEKGAIYFHKIWRNF